MPSLGQVISKLQGGGHITHYLNQLSFSEEVPKRPKYNIMDYSGAFFTGGLFNIKADYDCFILCNKNDNAFVEDKIIQRFEKDYGIKVSACVQKDQTYLKDEDIQDIMANSDVIMVVISQDFLNSPEQRKHLELVYQEHMKKNKAIIVIKFGEIPAESLKMDKTVCYFLNKYTPSLDWHTASDDQLYQLKQLMDRVTAISRIPILDGAREQSQTNVIDDGKEVEKKTCQLTLVEAESSEQNQQGPLDVDELPSDLFSPGETQAEVDVDAEVELD